MSSVRAGSIDAVCGYVTAPGPRRLAAVRRVVIAALAVLLLCPAQAARAQNLLLTLAAQPPLRGMISTASQQNLTLTVMSGHTVRFARASGRDYRLRASGGFSWTQVQELPGDADSIALTPSLREDGAIEVTVDVARKDDTHEQSYVTTVLAQPGEWVPLLGPAATPRGQTTYGTRGVDRDSLFLLVEPR